MLYNKQFKHDESIWASSLFGCRALHGFAQGLSNITVSATTLDDLKTLYQECLKLDKTIYEEGSWEFF